MRWKVNNLLRRDIGENTQLAVESRNCWELQLAQQQKCLLLPVPEMRWTCKVIFSKESWQVQQGENTEVLLMALLKSSIHHVPRVPVTFYRPPAKSS